MNKILLCSALLGSSIISYAGVNDTTTVVSHNKTQLSWYQAYDTMALFPDGSTDYRKIVMEFELGKYPCAGYNPSNPGEGSGQTGWCADWDYDVHVIGINNIGDTLELGRLITPYANSNMPRTPANWSHSYFYDVTDYYTFLKDSITVRIFYAGYSGGFTGTVKFHMIEGDRARDVVGYEKLWLGSYRYGVDTLPINDAVVEKTITVPTGATSAEMKFNITGHGGDNQENCAEFCRKFYRFKVDSVATGTTYIWRDDCGKNFLYPQSGTWVYDRGNWCPGDLVHTNIHKIPQASFVNGTFKLDVDFQNYVYNGPSPQASYKIGSTLFFYKDATHTVDAGLEEIISPNSDETYYRSNPVCDNAEVKIKNYGADTITSITFEYGIGGNFTESFTWNGSLASMSSANVFLPVLNALKDLVGNQTFNVRIASVNNTTDGDINNNELESKFVASPIYDYGRYIIEVKTPGFIDNRFTNTVTYTIKNNAGTVLFNKSYNNLSTVNKDVVDLPNGCYSLETSVNYGMGVNFFNIMPRGHIRMHQVGNTDTQRLAMPKTDLVNTNLEGNFGSNFIHNFSVRKDNILSVNGIEEVMNVALYPNPATHQVQVGVFGLATNAKKTVEMINILGQIVYRASFEGELTQINTSALARGVYSVVIKSENAVKTQKLVLQ